MLIAEVFGKGVDNRSAEANSIRQEKLCPFRNTKCTKSGKDNPLGVCSLSDGREAAALCPVRFLEGDLMFRIAGEIAFGPAANVAVFPEIKILRVENEDSESKKIGKVDFLLGKIVDGKVEDIAALEVQASYFSGLSIRPALNHFLAHGTLDPSMSDRRPDFRSSAQKRLMPQLQIKVPVFRRWGKKFFVVVDTQFFKALPKFKAASATNSELIWLNFPLERHGADYAMGKPEVVGALWDDVASSLREGQAPEPEEIYRELQNKLSAKSAGGVKTVRT